MSKTHTPSPWKHFRDADGSDIIGADGWHIARMEDMGPGGDIDGALLATAPELLAFARMFVDKFELNRVLSGDDYREMADAARTAIAKATK